MADREGMDRLDEPTRSAWPALEPPEGFADRVLAARSEGRAAEPPPPAGRSRLGLTAIAVLAVAGAIALFWRGSSSPAAEGELAASAARKTVELGGRGLAVAEAESALSWRVSERGAAVVEQGGGNVFYRVEPGGPFSVITPAGRVTATGTCFRVEVGAMKPSKHALVGAAVGAAVVVGVYEGSVLFANDQGTAEARAGETVSATPGAAPAVGEGGAEGAVAAAGTGAEAAARSAGLPAAPARDATREELLARDRVQRQEIAELRRKVDELAGQRASAGGRGGDGEEPWFDPSEESLRQFAKECKVRFDVPPQLFASMSEGIPADRAEALGWSDAERQAVNTAFTELHDKVRRQMRELYIEATGDVRGADSLSPSAMRSEIADKALPGEEARIRRQIARERAGLASAPADLSHASPLERYYRLIASLGDEAEQKLAGILGRSRAHELRANNGGWGARMSMAGCPDGDGAR